MTKAAHAGFGGDPQVPELQRMAVLQHHGTATRLLDVTTDPMIALWFAWRERRRQEMVFWLAGLALYALFLSWHVAQVFQHITPADRAPATWLQ